MSNLLNIPLHESELMCPRCGFEGGMHQGAVTSFDRNEDAAITRRTRITAERVEVRSVLSNSFKCKNPSSRRHGLIITFRCEGCGGGLDLCIAQHKGITKLFWRYPEVYELPEKSDHVPLDHPKMRTSKLCSMKHSEQIFRLAQTPLSAVPENLGSTPAIRNFSYENRNAPRQESLHRKIRPRASAGRG